MCDCEICLEENATVLRRVCCRCRGRMLCDECFEKCHGFCPICEASSANHTGTHQNPEVYIILDDTNNNRHLWHTSSIFHAMHCINAAIQNWGKVVPEPNRIGFLVTGCVIREDEMPVFKVGCFDDPRTLLWIWFPSKHLNV